MAAARVQAPCTLHVPADADGAVRRRDHRARPGPHGRRRPGQRTAGGRDAAARPLGRPRRGPCARSAHASAAGRRTAAPARPGWPFTATELSRAAALIELATQLSLAAPARAPSYRTRVLLLATDPRCCCARRGRRTSRSSTRCTRAARPRRAARGSSARRRAWRPTSCARSSIRRGGRRAGADPQTAAARSGSPTCASRTRRRRRRPAAALDAMFGVLVEDTWQHRGLGTALVRRRRGDGRRARRGRAHRHRARGRVRITRLLRRAGLRPTAVLADGTLRSTCHWRRRPRWPDAPLRVGKATYPTRHVPKVAFRTPSQGRG